MAELSYPLNDTWYYAEDAQLWHSTRTQGVFSSNNDLTVTALNVMKISVSTGIAWLKPSKFVNAVYANTDDLTLDINTADGYFNRYDRIVVKWDFVINSIYLAVKKGTPASSPQPPPLQRNAEAHEIAICDVLVRAGTLQINQGDIVDRRLDENLCGIMRDGVTQIPTQQLYDGWYAWFNSLKLDAETKAADFKQWISLFKSQNETNITQWLTTFKTKSQDDVDTWFDDFTESKIKDYNDFKDDRQNSFDDWFDTVQSTLDGDQAANLFNKIENHEKTMVDSTSGVHGIRFADGKLQVKISVGWITLATANLGQTWLYKDNLGLTWLQEDSFNRTWDEIENLMETEA